MRKHCLCSLLVFCLCFLIFLPATVGASGITSGITIGSDVAMRKQADVHSAVICKLPQGAQLKILQTNVNAEWDKVEYKGKTGYVNRIYVSFDSSLDQYQLSYSGTVINCNQFVYVRSTPSSKAAVIGNANKGVTLPILQKNTSGWDQVKLGDKTGYISTKYLDVQPLVGSGQLSALSVKGSSLYPAFSPGEYSYVASVTSSKVTITAKAGSGVKVDVNGSGKSSAVIAMPSGSMKTLYITLDGKKKYSLCLTRGVLTWGTWNIKSGNGDLLMQGRLVYDLRPDFMGIQETVQNTKSSNIVDDLAGLKTKTMSNTYFARTYYFSGSSEFGDGMLSSYKLTGLKTFALDSGGYEQRLLQKAVVKIGGKTVSVYNTHFTYNTQAVRDKQFSQVLEIMNKDPNKYKILTGDFNAKEAEFSVFKNYTVSISAEAQYYDPSGGLVRHNAIDNIIVTKNIKVIGTNIFPSSLSDHDPVFAYLVLK